MSNNPAFDQAYKRAAQMAQQGQYRDALQAFDASVEVAAQQKIPLAVSTLALVLKNLGFCYDRSGQWNNAIESYQQAERLLSRDEAFIREMSSGLGITLTPDKEEETRPQLAAIYEVLVEGHASRAQWPQVDGVMSRASKFLGNVKDYATLVRLWRRIAQLKAVHRNWPAVTQAAEQLYSNAEKARDSNALVEAQGYLADSCLQQGLVEETIKQFEKLVNLEKRVRHPKFTTDDGRLTDLRRRVKQGLPLLESEIGPSEGEDELRPVVEYLSIKGADALARKQVAEAQNWYAQCLATLKDVTSNHSFVAGVLYDLGRVAVQAGNRAQAEGFFDAAANATRGLKRLKQGFENQIGDGLKRIASGFVSIDQKNKAVGLCKEAAGYYRKGGMAQQAKEVEQTASELLGKGWLGQLLTDTDSTEKNHQFLIRADGRDAMTLTVPGNGDFRYQVAPGFVPPSEHGLEVPWLAICTTKS